MMEADGTSLAELRDTDRHLKNSTTTSLSRNHELLTQHITHTWYAAALWRDYFLSVYARGN